MTILKFIGNFQKSDMGQCHFLNRQEVLILDYFKINDSELCYILNLTGNIGYPHSGPIFFFFFLSTFIILRKKLQLGPWPVFVVSQLIHLQRCISFMLVSTNMLDLRYYIRSLCTYLVMAFPRMPMHDSLLGIEECPPGTSTDSRTVT